MPYKVVHLIDANINSAFFHWIAREHHSRRFPVCIGSVSPMGALQEALKDYSVETFSLGVTGRFQYPLAIHRLWRYLCEQRASIIHAHCFDPTLLALGAARMAGIRCVFTRHHSDHNIRLGKHWHTRIDAFSARNADRVIAVSEATRRILLALERVPEHKVNVVYNGLDPLPEADPKTVNLLRDELKLAQEPVCLMVGRLHEEKGHRFLFEAVRKLRETLGRIRIFLAGEGPHEAAIRSQARHFGIEPEVSFLGWRCEMSELMALSDVLVLPSLAESFGIVVVESMSRSLPVVTSTTGGIPELFEHGKQGLMVAPRSVDGLAEALNKVLSDPDYARALAQAGPEQAARFSADQMLRGYESVYESVLGLEREPVREEWVMSQS